MTSLQAEVRRALDARGVSASRAALDAGLPRRAIQNVLEGRQPAPGKLEKICAALGLEFYIGPPRLFAGNASLRRRLQHDLECAAGLLSTGRRLSRDDVLARALIECMLVALENLDVLEDSDAYQPEHLPKSWRSPPPGKPPATGSRR